MKWSVPLAWTIETSEGAQDDLARLDKQVAKRITAFLRKRVAALDKLRSIGEPLKSSHGELWRYRVGDYRVICQLQDSKLCVLVVAVGHRAEIYR
jgi:mRNA interferase RelE/StbE